MFRDGSSSNGLVAESTMTAEITEVSKKRSRRGTLVGQLAQEAAKAVKLGKSEVPEREIAGDALLLPHCGKACVGVVLIFAFPIVFLAGGIISLPISVVTCVVRYFFVHLPRVQVKLSKATAASQLLGPIARSLAATLLWLLILPLKAVIVGALVVVEAAVFGFFVGGACSCMVVWQFASKDEPNTYLEALHAELFTRGPAVCRAHEALADALIESLTKERPLHFVPFEADPVVFVAALLLGAVGGLAGALGFFVASAANIVTWAKESLNAGRACLRGTLECLDSEELGGEPLSPRHSLRHKVDRHAVAQPRFADSSLGAESSGEAHHGHVHRFMERHLPVLHQLTHAMVHASQRTVDVLLHGIEYESASGGHHIGGGHYLRTVRNCCGCVSATLNSVLMVFVLLTYMSCAALLILAWLLACMPVGFVVCFVAAFGCIYVHASRGLLKSCEPDTLATATRAVWHVLVLNYRVAGLCWRETAEEGSNPVWYAGHAVYLAFKEVQEDWRATKTIKFGSLTRDAGLGGLWPEESYFALGPTKLRWYASKAAFDSAHTSDVAPVGELSLSRLVVTLDGGAKMNCLELATPKLHLKGHGAVLVKADPAAGASQYELAKQSEAHSPTTASGRKTAISLKQVPELAMTLSDPEGSSIVAWRDAIVEAIRVKAESDDTDRASFTKSDPLTLV